MNSPTKPQARETVPAVERKPQPAKAGAGATRGNAAKWVSPKITTTPRTAPQKPTAPKKHGERIFVVSYKGSFVGFFEAESQLTPREAFIRIAADMAARDPHFEPTRLEIFKPVLIKSARPPEDMHLLRGKLRCVREKKRR